MKDNKMPSYKLIIFVVLTTLIIIFGLRAVNSIAKEEAQHKADKIRMDESLGEFRKCESSMRTINSTTFDLMKDYNLTCKKIDFIINNWVSKTTRVRKSTGFFSSEYEEKDYGVHKSIQLKRTVIVSEPSINNCSTTRSINTDIYLKEHFVNYYIEKCMED